MTASGNHHRAASRYPSGQPNGHRELIVQHTDAKNKWDGSATEFERKCCVKSAPVLLPSVLAKLYIQVPAL